MNFPDNVDYGSIVRDNLMTNPGYAPYCMGQRRNAAGGLEETPCVTRFRRMEWSDKKQQFTCLCGSCTEFDDAFIEGYVARWHQKKDHALRFRVPEEVDVAALAGRLQGVRGSLQGIRAQEDNNIVVNVAKDREGLAVIGLLRALPKGSAYAGCEAI